MDDMRGEIRVADQVVAVIAGVAAAEIDGITVRTGGFYHDLAKKLGGSGKGVFVVVQEGAVSIEMRVSIKYGMPIHELCRQLQEKVKDCVETMTGLDVEAVHVHVDGIDM
ncbi:Asp23/Gls24 family envelope stress response protein [Brevibacillus composti]|uniref:Asp23/Gls24 family envelope stress response protein n=1 Tax=Brevibacillus composti TaxID=2796470 RepID=A0A7T5JMB5_9BACL|nr:Asp23/Gls24 family envelope stress response protein [Brevibacillus composti]QQE72944.1 Asp23/Gls24 family envelope stress response protein [Brevibacillus composti]QUO40022.1 Asp23/Gls24 family envelope stress response protein [Brevibacillus composti]